MSGSIPVINGGTGVSDFTASKILMTASDKTLTSDDSNNLTITSYTPTIGDGTNNFGTTSALGYYVRVGSLIIGSLVINWNSKGSAASGSTVKVTIPVNIGATYSRVSCTVGFGGGIGFTGNNLTATATTGTNSISLFGLSGAGVNTSVKVSQCATSGEIQIGFCYGTN